MDSDTRGAMRFGIYVPNFGDYGDARRLADLARRTEDAGWDGVFVWDHVARPGDVDVVDPWIALAAIAMSTSSIRLGAMVTPLPRRRPWKVARETASLDHLSAGRLTFGVGLGSSRPVEWEDLGEETDLRTRGAMLDEALQIVTGLWSGERVEHQGAHYRVRDARFLPATLQQPRIPVWVAGVWPNKPPFRRAARWDGVFPLGRTSPFLDAGAIRDVVTYVRSHRSDGTPFDVIVGGRSVNAGDTDTAAAAGAAGATWWLEWAESKPGSLAAMTTRVLAGPPRP